MWSPPFQRRWLCHATLTLCSAAGGAPKPLPIGLEDLEEYEAFQERCARASGDAAGPNFPACIAPSHTFPPHTHANTQTPPPHTHTHTHSFWREVRDHTQGAALDLDDLPDGSLLEGVYVLGKLREEGGPLEVRDLARRARGVARQDFK